MDIIIFFSTLITDIINSFTNLNTCEIFILIPFIALIITNNVYTLNAFFNFGPSCEPPGQLIKMLNFHYHISKQILITLLFTLLFMNLNPLQYIVLNLLIPSIIFIIFTIIKFNHYF